MLEPVRDPNIYKGNSYTIEFDLSEPDEETGQPGAPAPALTDVEGIISAGDGSSDDSPLTPIHSELVVALAVRSKAPRHYFGKISGAVVNARLFGTPDVDNPDTDSDYANEWVYVAMRDASGELLGIERVQCLAVRLVPGVLP
jgi:hypothetical protein